MNFVDFVTSIECYVKELYYKRYNSRTDENEDDDEEEEFNINNFTFWIDILHNNPWTVKDNDGSNSNSNKDNIIMYQNTILNKNISTHAGAGATTDSNHVNTPITR